MRGGWNDNEERVMQAIGKEPGINAQQIRKLVERVSLAVLTVRDVRNALRRPVREGVIVRAEQGCYRMATGRRVSPTPARRKASPSAGPTARTRSLEEMRARVYALAEEMGTTSSSKLAPKLGLSRGFVVRAFAARKESK